MSEARNRFVARIRRLADNLEAELAAMPNEASFPPGTGVPRVKSPTQIAAYLKSSHVINRMHTIGEWIAELVEAGDLDAPPAASVLQGVDAFRSESEAKGMVPNSRGYITFWYFLRDWLPHHSADFDRETDGNVGSGNVLFPTIMVRNIRTLADGIEAAQSDADDLVTIVLANLPAGVADATRKAVKLLAQGVKPGDVAERLNIGVDNSRKFKSLYVTPHMKKKT